MEIAASTSDEEKTYAIRPGEPLSLISADRMALDIRGLGRIEIRSGSADVKQLLRQIAEAKEALKEILDRYGVATLSELKAVSYTHLDVYKRQGLAQSMFAVR